MMKRMTAKITPSASMIAPRNGSKNPKTADAMMSPETMTPKRISLIVVIPDDFFSVSIIIDSGTRITPRRVNFKEIDSAPKFAEAAVRSPPERLRLLKKLCASTKGFKRDCESQIFSKSHFREERRKLSA